MHIIAHRGYSSDHPENTLASFDFAIENGFYNIELDIHMTKDGIPVVMHDADVSRTTDGSGLISEMTFEQIKRLNAGSWFKDKSGSDEFDKSAEDLRLATRHLGKIVGRVDVEEVLDSIFNDFCVGK